MYVHGGMGIEDKKRKKNNKNLSNGWMDSPYDLISRRDINRSFAFIR